MTDVEKILWTAAATLLGGVLLVVFGQLVIRFLIEPLHEQRKTIGRIAEALINHQHFIVNSGLPPAGVREAADQLRGFSSELLAKTIDLTP